MEYGLEEYQYRNAWKEISLPTLPVIDAIDTEHVFQSGTDVTLHIEANTIELNVLLGKEEEVTVKTSLKEVLTAPVAAGTKVGNVAYLLNGIPFANYDIVTDQNVEKRTYKWCFEILMKNMLL